MEIKFAFGSRSVCRVFCMRTARITAHYSRAISGISLEKIPSPEYFEKVAKFLAEFSDVNSPSRGVRRDEHARNRRSNHRIP